MKNESGRRQSGWPDRTLSILRARRLEACEREFEDLGGRGLFDAETTDLDAENLFDQSYGAEEEKPRRLHTIEEMRVAVLSQLPAEIGLLTEEEFNLVVKLALVGGEMPLTDWNDLLPARSLVRRLWCRTSPEKGRWIRMPRQICVAALLMLASEEIKTVRETVTEITDRTDNTLYLAGAMPAEIVLKDMETRLRGTLAADKPALYLRMLKAGFECVPNRQGGLLLVHPGLAEPGSLLRGGRETGAGLDQRSLQELYDSLMDVEDPLYNRMLSQIQELCRPEADPEETVEDLILLAKQDAPAEDMMEVLSSRLICLPTGEMASALRELHDRIPRWTTLNMERVQ